MKKKSNVNFSREMEDANKEVCVQTCMCDFRPCKRNVTIVEHMNIEKNCVIDQKQSQQRATTERRDSQKPQVAQVSEMSEENEKESVTKIAAATVRGIFWRA